jgi:uncharacterized protein YabE (DUF348 family)/3D (Asp-Asp-Asp) domain-containing protein
VGTTAIQIEEPHVKRSSSMSFALRWKHENMRMAALVAVLAFTLTFMFFMLLYGTATKRVSVVVNGQETIVDTKQWDLKHLLDEKAITIGEHDRISTDLGAKVKNGDRITIETASPIRLTADGETKTLYTTQKTVSSALQDLNITLGQEDKIFPSLDTPVSGAAEIKIVRVNKQVEEQNLPIAFSTVTKQDASLLKGKEQTVQDGKEGVKVIKTEKVFEDGKLVSQNIINETVQAESVNKVVAVGSKNPVVTLSAAADSTSPKADTVTKGGIPFTYKQILNNVTITAYAAGVSSTGKSKGDSGYGVTYTGTTVQEGRTIAVDKNVIPLGWWVYIEGIGYRRAEDTGSAVKGNHIDVYYDSDAYADRFGVKRGYTVYVIGPKKPTAE